MKKLIVALATSAALIAPSATLALDGVFTFPTFYDEFEQASGTAPVAKQDTASVEIITIKAKAKQDADN